MMRMGFSAAACAAALVIAAVTARAQSESGENDDSRFTLHRAAGGFLRLDGRTGQVSLCSRPRRGAWHCQAVTDERSALDAEIARLKTENAELKKQLAARAPAVPAINKPDPDPPTATVRPLPRPPSDGNSSRGVGFFERVWRRVVEMIVSAQRDIMKTS
jgi:hypothetical protein